MVVGDLAAAIVEVVLPSAAGGGTGKVNTAAIIVVTGVPSHPIEVDLVVTVVSEIVTVIRAVGAIASRGIYREIDRGTDRETGRETGLETGHVIVLEIEAVVVMVAGAAVQGGTMSTDRPAGLLDRAPVEAVAIPIHANANLVVKPRRLRIELTKGGEARVPALRFQNPTLLLRNRVGGIVKAESARVAVGAANEAGKAERRSVATAVGADRLACLRRQRNNTIL